MAKIEISVRDDEEITGLIKIEKRDDEEEIIHRKITEGVSLSNLLSTQSNGALHLGNIEINLDFDQHGNLVQIEFYS